MAGNGPPPKETRRRRNADTYADVQARVVDDGEVRGPELPGEHSSYVREWYEQWRRSPQAASFVNTDWQRLHMLAPLVGLYALEPSPKLLGEIRLNESLLGATHVDRLRARIRVEREPEPEEAGGVTSLDRYRAKLGG